MGTRRKVLKWSVAFGAILLLGGCAAEKGHPPSPGGGRYSVYLTTDDGPLRCSGNLNAVVLEEMVPLEAFVVGKHARSKLYRSYLEAYRANPYITLAIHSYTHADGHYLSYYNHPEKILEEFERTKRELNLPGRVGRLPGRDSWRIGGRAYDADRSATRAANLLAAHGWRLYGWDLEWTHTRSGRPIGSAETIYRKIRVQLQGGHTFTPEHLVLLMHDQMFGTPRAREELKHLIERLKQDPEIRLRALSDYPLHALPAPTGHKPHLLPAPATGVGETSPLDPLEIVR